MAPDQPPAAEPPAAELPAAHPPAAEPPAAEPPAAQSPAAEWPGSARDAARAVAALVLLGVAAAGLNTAAPLTSGAGLVHVGGRAGNWLAAGVAVAGLGVVCALLAVFARRPRRRKGAEVLLLARQEQQWPWWTRPAVLLLVLAVLATPVAALTMLGRRHGTAPTRSLRPGPFPEPAITPTAASHLGGARANWQVVVFAAALLLIALASYGLVRTLSRFRAARRRQEPPAVLGPLTAAIAAGAAALDAQPDPRAAIIACYRAMERALSQAGSAPAVADTPAQVLTRAEAAGLLPARSAGEELAGLFRRARYSRHVLSETDRLAAAGALGKLRAGLRERAG